MRRTTRIGVVLLATAATCLGTVSPANATVPGGNGRIAYARGVKRVRILYVAPDGSFRHALTPPASVRADPAWAPNGSQLAAEHVTAHHSAIFTMQADGDHPRRVTSGAFDIEPAWSPDGTEIAFARCCASATANSFSLFVIDLNGAVVRHLRFEGKADLAPAFSPNGDRIAFERCCFHPRKLGVGTSEIFVWNVHTGGVRRLTDDRVEDRAPDWSPDGRSIVFQQGGAFTGDPVPPEEARAGDVVVVDADGAASRQLTTGGDAYEPSFSPDGQRIVYGACRHPSACDLSTMNTSGGDVDRITSGRAIESNPVWRPVHTGRPS
jgi:Tol biopolymer transport system component